MHGVKLDRIPPRYAIPNAKNIDKREFDSSVCLKNEKRVSIILTKRYTLLTVKARENLQNDA
jgi:hypothetical protein